MSLRSAAENASQTYEILMENNKTDRQQFSRQIEPGDSRLVEAIATGRSAVCAMNVLIDGGRDRDPRGLAYIHTELSHQHTGYSAGHTLCASGSPFTHAVSSSALTSPADPRVYCARAILYVCRRTRSDAGRRARPGGWQCLNLDGGGLALAGESSH